MAAYLDFELDLTTGDRVVRDGDWGLVEGRQAVGQWIFCRFKTGLGEWYSNALYGLDLEGKIWVKPPDLGIIEAHLKTLITGVPGVVAIQTFTLTWDRTQRELVMDTQVLSDEGPVRVVAVGFGPGAAGGFMLLF